MKGRRCLALSSLLPLLGWSAEPVRPAVEALYQRHCAACHLENRLGGNGPALLPTSLERMNAQKVENVIAQGRPATQMPGFADKLSREEMQALTQWLFQPPATPPVWDLDRMKASHKVFNAPGTLPAQPVHAADPMNLFVVVELGDHHITILDGDRLEPIHRQATHFALHGGPKFSPDGRFVYMASRDGWISKFDLWSLKMVAEIRAGLNTRNLAMAGDGRTVMVANQLPHTLVALEADQLTPLKIIPVDDGKGGASSRVSAVYAAPPRNSFIAALKDMSEIWEIPYNDRAAPVVTGMVHDYRGESGEELPVDKSPFPVRRILVDQPLDDFFFDSGYTHLVGTSRQGQEALVVNLDVRRVIRRIPLPGMPHLASGITWNLQGTPVLVTPHIKESRLSVIDMTQWKVVASIPTLGPGFFLRSHENTPHAWVDAFHSPDHRDTIQVIDKNTLELVRTLQPAPGKTAAHVEFTRDGRFALVSIWEDDGAVVVYDAATLEEVKRLAMRKPSGKYNVHNKITRSAGTSH